MTTQNDLELAEFVIQLREKYGRMWAFRCTTEEVDKLKSFTKVPSDGTRSK